MRSNPTRCLLAVLVAAVAAVVACRSGGPGPDHAQRLVMVSYDGVGGDLAWQWLDDGTASHPEGLAVMADRGFAVRRLRMVDPTLTAVNHISLVTGRAPAQTGVVGNWFHRPHTPITKLESGFSAPIESETLWQSARRQGRRVGVLLWPGCDGASEARRADFGLLWPAAPLAASAIVELDAEDARPAAELVSEDGLAALQWLLPVEHVGAEPPGMAWQVGVFDGTADGRPRYDTIAVRAVGVEVWEYVEDQSWFGLAATARGAGDERGFRYGAWCKVTRLDRFVGSVRLYRGAFFRLLAYPEQFASSLEDDVGFWPGPPDDRLLADWWLDVGQGLDLDSYLEQVERLDRYLDRVAEHAIASEQFQLLLAYHPTPDEYQHSSLVVDRRQQAYSPGSELAAREGLRQVGRSVDLSVATLWRALNPVEDALVVVSDHGLLPRHDAVNLNRALAEAGLVDLVTVDGRVRLAATTPMAVVASGASAHLYLNLDGREPGGVVSAVEAPELLGRAARVLADLEVDGEPVVERVVDRAQAPSLGLDHRNSGDLVVFLRPGYGTATHLDAPVIGASQYYGDHGYLSAHDGMCGMLLARGAGVRRARHDEVPVTHVPILVATWMGFSFPSPATP